MKTITTFTFKLLGLCLLPSAFCLPALAQGTAFTYQGRLNIGASPANGTYDLTFALFSVNSGAGQVGNTTTNAATTISNGLFTVTLDFGAGIFTGPARWLEIGVRTNGNGAFSTLAPRQAVTATPYAITAGNLSGTLPATQLTGTLPNAQLSASVSLLGASIDSAEITDGTITANNLNASVLNGTFWNLGGNTGANPTNGNFIGTADNLPLEFKLNGLRVLRLEQNTNGAPNVIGGSFVNYVSDGVVGATISGGGTLNYASNGPSTNSVTANYGTVGGGTGNGASAYNATVSGGGFNIASGSGAAVGGGYSNTASGPEATVTGGEGNTADGSDATIGGGNYNTASGQSSTISGGDGNTVFHFATTVGGGWLNTAINQYATVPGGYKNTAWGMSSFAAGQHANANHDGSFVWADAQDSDFSSTTTNQFSIRASGGVRLSGDTPALSFGSNARQMINLFGTTYGIGVQSSTTYFRSNSRFSWFRDGVHSDTQNDPGAGGVVAMTLTSGGLTVNGTFVNASDRNAKQDFQPVNTQDVLAKVSALPLSQWRYKADEAGSRHLGPMAQDFHAAFGLGEDDKHIATVDEGGVALAAIQGLNQKFSEQEARLKNKDSEIQELRQAVAALQKIVSQITNKTQE